MSRDVSDVKEDASRFKDMPLTSQEANAQRQRLDVIVLRLNTLADIRPDYHYST
jgi:hypothetical protein